MELFKFVWSNVDDFSDDFSESIVGRVGYTLAFGGQGF